MRAFKRGEALLFFSQGKGFTLKGLTLKG